MTAFEQTTQFLDQCAMDRRHQSGVVMINDLKNIHLIYIIMAEIYSKRIKVLEWPDSDVNPLEMCRILTKLCISEYLKSNAML